MGKFKEETCKIILNEETLILWNIWHITRMVIRFLGEEKCIRINNDTNNKASNSTFE
jgi:hypothetical protein